MSVYPSVFRVADKEDQTQGYYWSDSYNNDYDEMIESLKEEHGDDFCEENSGYIEVEQWG